MRGPVVTDCGNFDGLRKFYACSTEYFSYTRQNIMELLLKLHKLFIQIHIWTLKEVFSVTNHSSFCEFKTSIRGNVKFPRNMEVESFELFSFLLLDFHKFCYRKYSCFFRDCYHYLEYHDYQFLHAYHDFQEMEKQFNTMSIFEDCAHTFTLFLCVSLWCLSKLCNAFLEGLGYNNWKQLVLLC